MSATTTSASTPRRSKPRSRRARAPSSPCTSTASLCDIDAARRDLRSPQHRRSSRTRRRPSAHRRGGRRAGAFGTGCFSFYATKNLQTGEGGMITTDDDAVAERLRLPALAGRASRYVTEDLGYNYRMTEIAAALGLAQLPKLDARNATRRANAARLNELLAGNEQIITPREMPGRRARLAPVHHPRPRRPRSPRPPPVRPPDRGIESAASTPPPSTASPSTSRLGYGDISSPSPSASPPKPSPSPSTRPHPRRPRHHRRRRQRHHRNRLTRRYSGARPTRAPPRPARCTRRPIPTHARDR